MLAYKISAPKQKKGTQASTDPRRMIRTTHSSQQTEGLNGPPSLFSHPRFPLPPDTFEPFDRIKVLVLA